MKKQIKITGIFLFCIMACFLVKPTTADAKSKLVTTPIASLSKNTYLDEFTATVNSSNGTRSFHIFSQQAKNLGKRSFIAQHGCAACSLTTVLSGYTKKYKDLTPQQTTKQLEKKVFGTKVWKANYSKPAYAQMPVSLYGITKVLNYCKVKNKYVRFFKDKSAIKTIEQHLKTGNAVIVELNSHKQKNGRFSSAYTTRWSSSKHTVVLMGMTESGKVIMADSADRSWSGQKQRVKFTTMKHLIQYMIPCKGVSNSRYYNSVATSGGFILVNP